MSYVIAKNKWTFIRGLQDPGQLTEFFDTFAPIIGIAIVGRSNVGKSSLINALFGKSTARVSKTPGRTREVNTFTFKLQLGEAVNDLHPGEFYLFDLPGYGFADISKTMAQNWDAMISTYFDRVPDTVLVIDIQDARHPHTRVDQEFYNFINFYEMRMGLVFNKIDKLKTQKERQELRSREKTISDFYKMARSIHYVSAEKGTGLKEFEASLVKFILDCYEIEQKMDESSER